MVYKYDIINLQQEGKTYQEICNILEYLDESEYYILDGKKLRVTERSEHRRTELRKMIGKIKEQSGCVDCKNMFPYFVLDFDHVNGQKIDSISRMIKVYSINDILNEIQKCDIVCANCHRIRTQKRKGL